MTRKLLNRIAARLAVGAVSLAVILTLTATRMSAGEAVKPLDLNQVVATVNGHDIVMSDVMLAAGIPLTERRRDALVGVYMRALDALITNRAVADEARRQGVDKGAAIQRHLADSRDAALARQLMAQRAHQPPTEEETRGAYDLWVEDQRNRNPIELRLSRIVVVDEKTANDAIARLNKGESFAAVAKQLSIFSDEAAKGGDLGFHELRTMDRIYGLVANDLKPGTYTPKPIRMATGWNIVRLDERRGGVRLPSYEQVKNDARKLAGQLNAEALSKAQLEKATIKRYIVEGLAENARTGSNMTNEDIRKTYREMFGK